MLDVQWHIKHSSAVKNLCGISYICKCLHVQYAKISLQQNTRMKPNRFSEQCDKVVERWL